MWYHSENVQQCQQHHQINSLETFNVSRQHGSNENENERDGNDKTNEFVRKTTAQR